LASRRIIAWCLVFATAGASGVRRASAQAPTIPEAPPGAPGSTTSNLGPPPGAGAIPFGMVPGADQMILEGGRPGPSFPRVPSSISMPGGGMAPPSAPVGIAAPSRLPITNVPLFGPLALPEGAEEEGPPGGLTLDEAIERLVRDNVELRWKAVEVPLARADVLTASLRANPILFADGQLVPYGQYSRRENGGPTQYDLNVSHPIDVSRKRAARVAVAERAATVLEAQYQDAVRLQIDNLYTAYVDVLAARETVRFAQAGVAGLGRVLEVTEKLYEKSTATRPDVGRMTILRHAAAMQLAEAEATLRRTKRTLGVLLNVPPDRAEAIELRGTIADLMAEPPPADELVRLAMGSRPDLAAQRLGIRRAEADVRLARANRMPDIYLLYQPYTFQDLAPLGQKSATSWALGATVPLPVHNRNQGTIRRAVLNVEQTQVELAALERRVAAEVIQAGREYAASRAAVRRVEAQVLPAARELRDDAFALFTAGEQDALAYSNAQRDYNEAVLQYRGLLIRHRRSMLALNTAVGRRVLP
jgi:outer membrane protein, heavy metal efflux system